MAKTQAPSIKADADFVDGVAAPQGGDFATADMIRSEDGKRTIEIRFRVEGDLLTMTETGKNATQWCKIDVGGAHGWKMAMTLFVPASQLTPQRFAKAVARRKAKLAKIADAGKARNTTDMVD